MTITQRYINESLMAERRIMGTILGAVEMDSNKCRYKINHEIEEELDGETIIVGINKAQRIKFG